MKNTILLEKIRNYQNSKNPIILENLILQFTPLFKKYASKLSFEDSMQEFYLLFIKIVNKIPLNKLTEDKYVISYINSSIKNKYINLSKKNFKDSSVLELDYKYFKEEKSSKCIEEIDLILSLSNLSEKENYIIYSIFLRVFP